MDIEEREREQRERDARIARLRNEQERLKEIENQQWAKLQQLENLRKGAEEDLKRTQIIVNAQRISELTGNSNINLSEEEIRQRNELLRANEAMKREAAEVDRQLEASQIETARLQNLLRAREAEVS